MRRVWLVAVLFLVLIPIYGLIQQLQVVWPFTLDDTYITLRYARHWAAGYGILWNLGEPPVEGYSNFSFLVLARLAFIFGFNPIIVFKIVGIISLFVLLMMLFCLSRFWVAARFAWIPSVWLSAYCGQIIWSVSGLETTFYQMLMVTTVYLLLRGIRSSKRNRSVTFIGAGITLALAGLTRPEAVACMLVFLSLVAWHAKSEPALWLGWRQFFLTLVICFLPYFIWRVTYFHHLFPNPVYCKGFVDRWNTVLDQNYLRLIWPFALVTIPLFRASKQQEYIFLWILSVVYLLLCFGADPVSSFLNRLFLPAFALLLPLTLIALVQWCRRDWLIYTVSGIWLLGFVPMMSLADYRHFTVNPRAGEHLRRQVLQWLDAHSVAGQQVALADSGLIPYYSQLPFIDTYCLNNLTMTQSPRMSMYGRICRDILKKQVPFIILTAHQQRGRIEYTPADACLSKILALSKDYQEVARFKSFENASDYYQYIIYARSL